jgi:3-hydroxymyristoyl/3-hydroxydecanoyl-(acyl carrier protein) dehydratase
VGPGDQLRLEVELTGWREVPSMIAARMQGVAYVGDKRVAEASLSCRLVDSARGRGSAAGDAEDEG